MEGWGPSTPSYNPGEQGDSISSCWHSFRREPWEATGTFLSKKEAIKTPSESKNKTLAWEELKKKKKKGSRSSGRVTDKACGPTGLMTKALGVSAHHSPDLPLWPPPRRGWGPRTPEPMTALGTHPRAPRGACLFPLLGKVNGRM